MTKTNCGLRRQLHIERSLGPPQLSIWQPINALDPDYPVRASAARQAHLPPFNIQLPSRISICKMWCVTLSLCLILLHQSNHARAAPHPAGVLPPSHSVPLQPHVPYTDSNPNEILWTPSSPKRRPQPLRSGEGATLIGPENVPLELQNADLLAPPTTDNGQVKNFKWPFSFSHSKLKDGGWSRQQTGQCLLTWLSLIHR